MMQVFSWGGLVLEIIAYVFLYCSLNKVHDIAVLSVFPRSTDSKRISDIFIFIPYINLPHMWVYHIHIMTCILLQFWKLKQHSSCCIEE